MNQQPQSAFFRLPPEVRNKIYGYTLYIPTPSGMIDLMSRSNREIVRKALSVLLLCRKANAEARDMFCYINRIVINFGGQRIDFEHRFRDILNKSYFRAVTSMTIRGIPTAEYCTVVFKRMRCMTQLTNVRVDLEPAGLWGHRDYTSYHMGYLQDSYIGREAPFLRKAILMIESLESVELNIRQRYPDRPPGPSARTEWQDFESEVQQLLADRQSEE